jgi:amino acid transporter
LTWEERPRTLRSAPEPNPQKQQKCPFYSFITAGLGRPTGLASGFLAASGYFCSYVGTFCFAGLAASQLIHNTFNGPELPWWLLALVIWALVGTIGYFHIELSARVLTVALFCEILVTIIYDTAVFLAGGHDGLHITPFTPGAFLSGSVGLALLFALGMFGGFEATAIFRDEVKDPVKTVPRATYLVVFSLATLYAVTAYAYIMGVGMGTVVQAATESTSGSAEANLAAYAGKLVLDIATVLVVSSSFATNIASHNITGRYLFNLAADGILPQPLAKVHPRQHSPYIASIVTSVAALIVLAPFALFGADPLITYTTFIGVLSLTLVASMFLTNISVVTFIRRAFPAEASLFNTVIAPTIAGIGLAVTLVLTIWNFDLMVDGSWTKAGLMLAGLAALFLLGYGMAVRLRSSRPEIYQRIGRQ